METVAPYRSHLACETYFNSSLTLSTVCSQMALVSIQLAQQHAMPHGVSCFAIEVLMCRILRVAIDRPDLLQALFPVVAQGLLPGEQTIYRAEVAALVQVVRLAAALPQQTFHAWADSSSALSVVQKWLDSTVDEPFSSSAGDLLALLPHRRPSNLVLHKVKISSTPPRGV